MRRQGGSPRRARLVGSAVFLATACVLLGAAPAVADDASVLRAWESNDAQFAVLGRQVERATVTFRRTRRAGPLLGALARTRALIIRTRKAVLAEQASTPVGASARLAALHSLSYFERSIRSLSASAVALTRGQPRTALALARRSEAEIARAEQLAERAKAFFRQAGLSPR